VNTLATVYNYVEPKPFFRQYIPGEVVLDQSSTCFFLPLLTLLSLSILVFRASPCVPNVLTCRVRWRRNGVHLGMHETRVKKQPWTVLYCTVLYCSISEEEEKGPSPSRMSTRRLAMLRPTMSSCCEMRDARCAPGGDVGSESTHDWGAGPMSAARNHKNGYSTAARPRLLLLH
jgi:hypothetical protein